MIVDELISILGYRIEPGSQRTRNKYQGALDNLQRKAQQVAVGMAKVGAGIAAAAVPAMTMLGKSVIRTSAQFEKFEAQLTTTLGDNGKAKAALGWIEDFTAKTPYELAKVVDSFQRLTTQGLDPLANDTLRILGDTAAAMGEPLERAVEAFSDASMMEFERLKAFGVRARQEGDQVTFVWTRNGEELTQTLKKNGEDIRRFLLDNFGERFAGAMERQNRTYDGMLSNLGDRWTSFKLAIGNAGFFDTVKDKLQGLLDAIARLDADGSLDRWATSISNVLSAGTNAAGAVFGQFAGHIRTLANAVSRAPDGLGKWATALGAFAGWRLLSLFPISRAIGALALAFDEIMSTIEGKDTKLGDLGRWFAEWSGLVPANGGGTTQGITAAASALESFASAAERAVKAVDQMMRFFDAKTSWSERFDAFGKGSVDLFSSILPEEQREAVRALDRRGGLLGADRGGRGTGRLVDDPGERNRLMWGAQRDYQYRRNQGRLGTYSAAPPLQMEVTPLSTTLEAMRRDAAASIGSVITNNNTTQTNTINVTANGVREAAQDVGAIVRAELEKGGLGAARTYATGPQ